jgi:hypothetical protein
MNLEYNSAIDTSQPLLDVIPSSINFNQYTQASLTPLYTLTENKSYIPIPSCVLEYIITATNLSNLEKLFYLLAYSLELTRIGLGKKEAIALSADDWAKRLGCSRSKVFAMQKSLVKKGYFIIESGKNKGQNNHNIRNLITPILPKPVFKYLSKTDDRRGEHLPYNGLIESKISYLNRTKLFIPLNYQLLKLLTANNVLNSAQKIFWLDFYSRCYKCHKHFDKMQLKDGEFGTNVINGANHSFYFVSSYEVLAAKYGCDKKYLSKILMSLEKAGFIAKQRVFNMKDKIEQRRKDQSLWIITLLLPHNCALELQKVKDRVIIKPVEDSPENDNKTLNSDADTELEKDNIDHGELDEPIDDTTTTEEYSDSVIDELEDLPEVSDNTTLSTNFGDNFEDINSNKNTVAVFDHVVANSALPYNIHPLPDVKDIQSNLNGTPKVIFNKFLKQFDFKEGKFERKKQKKKQFSICSALIREKIKNLPKNKIDKAKKFAYSLFFKKLAIGYAATLDKHQLAKQFIFHIATWKPTKLNSISQENEIDTALAIAWKAATNGTWKIPLQWAKAQVLDHEFRLYQQKYQHSGVLSHDIKALENDVCKLLGYSHFDLEKRITEGTETTADNETLPALAVQQNYHLDESFDVSNLYSSSESKTHYLDDLPEETNQQPYVSELVNNFELYEKLERQGYFEMKFTEDSMLFKTNLVNNQKYLPVIKDVKVDRENVYMTLKFTKQTIYDSDPLNLEQQHKQKFLN